MSKWSDDFEKQHKNVKKVKEVTKEILKRGGKLANEEIHEAKSLERLKKCIKEK